MIDFDLKTKGLKGFNKALRKFPDRTRREMLKVIRTACVLVQRQATKDAPADTGKLRQAIFSEVDEHKLKGVVGVDPRIAPHGPTVEFGRQPGADGPPANYGSKPNVALARWSQKHGGDADLTDRGAVYALARKIHRTGIKARPFLTPALQENERKIYKLFQDAIDRILAL